MALTDFKRLENYKELISTDPGCGFLDIFSKNSNSTGIAVLIPFKYTKQKLQQNPSNAIVGPEFLQRRRRFITLPRCLTQAVNPLIERNYCSRSTMVMKASTASGRPIYASSLPTTIIINDHILAEHIRC
ncbi:hypothetical protein T10_2153 [Trichinella papuae]|uniref:Uncharacterized protein n=1 Tax=Trichinella papuae TaxID=268474 RepID=A0A0V1M3L8_9BILA|nr:hypothetical protein T10_2153 [Trichinella papuae]